MTARDTNAPPVFNMGRLATKAAAAVLNRIDSRRPKYSLEWLFRNLTGSVSLRLTLTVVEAAFRFDMAHLVRANAISCDAHSIGILQHSIPYFGRIDGKRVYRPSG